MNYDRQVRLAAFNWLAEQTKIHGDILPRALLQKGFEFSGKRVPLVAPQGIFTPKILNYPISITTAPGGPYEDAVMEGDFIAYKYRGENPDHRDNVGLREAMRLKLPLVYFYGIVPGRYVPAWPVFVIADNPGALEFTVAVEEPGVLDESRAGREGEVREEDLSKKAYITRTTLFRLHQRSFREKVLTAYREQCALCRLRHKELLDAAHIIPDAEEHGVATVNNGISLCKLHHAAFDRFLIGITPDFTVKVKLEILEEKDGPMLQHGLKDLDQIKIILPGDEQDWPNRDFLNRRYEEFSQRNA